MQPIQVHYLTITDNKLNGKNYKKWH